MRITSWLLLLLCFAALGLLGGLLFTGGEKTPKELLASANSRNVKRGADSQAALRDLNAALILALEEKPQADKRLVADILLKRGTLLKEMSAITPARNDFQAILDNWRPDDPVVERELIDLDLRAGDLEKALERTATLLKREQDLYDVWMRRGLILVRISDIRVAQCNDIIDGSMAQEAAREARELVLRASGMDLVDPKRVAVLYELKSHFEVTEENEARDVLRLVDLASKDLTDARNSLVLSMHGRLDTEPVLAYLRLLSRSGRLQDAVDFGLSVLPFSVAYTSRAFVLELLETLVQMGRPDKGADIVDKGARGLLLDRDAYATYCAALYDAGRWQDLLLPANQMRAVSADDSGKSIATFYLGVAQARTKQYDKSMLALLRYTERGAVEPFPGALAIAWREIADSAHRLREVYNEKPALLEAVKLDPENSGVEWERLADALKQTEPESPDRIEEALAHAIRLQPAKRAELMPRWEAAGQVSMKSSGTDLELLFEELSIQGLSTPAGPAGSYELLQLARLHHAKGQDPQAMSACRRLLATYPGFLPAVELYADLAEENGELDTAAEQWLEHLRRAGPEPEVIARLQAIPRELLSDAQKLALIKIDPEHTGRLLVAATLREEGRPLDALTGLYAQDTAPLGDVGRILIAKLYTDLKRWGPALDALDAIQPTSPQFSEAIPLALDAAIAAQDDQRVTDWIRRVASAGNLEPKNVVSGADLLLSGGFPAQAGELCDSADAAASGRSGGVILRRAQVSMLAGDRAAADEDLDRSAAFEAGGNAELGRLLLAIQDRLWNKTPSLAREVVGTSSRPTRLQSAILALLDERVDESQRLLAEASRQEPIDPLWTMAAAAVSRLRGPVPEGAAPFGEANRVESEAALQGASGGDRDPRDILGWLLALENRDWIAWVVADLTRVSIGEPGSSWTGYMAARGLLELGERERAEGLLQRLVAAFPTFEPGWDLYEDVLQSRLGGFDDLELARLREARRAALGNASGDRAESLLLRALDMQAAGEKEKAIRHCKAALDVDPKFVPALVRLAELLGETGQWLDAVTAYAQACALATEESASPVVTGFVELLQRAAVAAPDQVTVPLRTARVDALARRFARDPLVALEQARLDIARVSPTPAIAVASAYDRLARFREATAGQPVDALRRGAARAWKDFYAGLDPARAESFLRGDLEKRPGSLELWVMLGDVLAQRGHPDEAIEMYELAQRMVPDGQTRRAIAWLASTSGIKLADVAQSIDEAMRLERLEKADLDLEFTLARALVNANVRRGEEQQQLALWASLLQSRGPVADLLQPLADAGPSMRDKGIRLLERLWAERERATGRVSVADIGQLYGTALVQRMRSADRQTANQVLTEVGGMVTDPARRSLLKALSFLALQIPSRQQAN